MTVAAWASGFPPAPAAPAAAIPTEFAANSGWTNASGMTVANSAAYPAPHPSGRTQGLRLQKPTASFGGARTSTLTLPNFKLSDYAVIGFDIYGIVTSGSINLRFSSDNFATKRREVSWSFPNYFINGWQRLTIRPTDDGTTAEGGATWTVTGGQALDEPINAVQVSWRPVTRSGCPTSRRVLSHKSNRMTGVWEWCRQSRQNGPLMLPPLHFRPCRAGRGRRGRR